MLVSVSAPPIPSIWRTSGEPIAASSTRSRTAESLGITTTDTVDGKSASSNVAITVTPVDDPPSNTVPGAQSVNENTTLTLTGGTVISLADIDANEAGTGILSVTLSVLHGTVSVGGSTGGLLAPVTGILGGVTGGSTGGLLGGLGL